jgi:hypothetical protein
MDVDVGAREESVVEGQHSEYTQGETPVPIVAVEPHLEVLGRTTAALGTNSSSLSFRWAMEGPVYTERGDGYYYDVEGVWYNRLCNCRHSLEVANPLQNCTSCMNAEHLRTKDKTRYQLNHLKQLLQLRR